MEQALHTSDATTSQPLSVVNLTRLRPGSSDISALPNAIPHTLSPAKLKVAAVLLIQQLNLVIVQWTV